jgi:hypothetical protein
MMQLGCTIFLCFSLFGNNTRRNLEADLKDSFSNLVRDANTQFIADYKIDPSNVEVDEVEIK